MMRDDSNHQQKMERITIRRFNHSASQKHPDWTRPISLV